MTPVWTSTYNDNDRSWSGDHCVDPSIVPGVFLSNRAIETEAPRLMDIPASVLRLFGQEIPGYMQGEMIFPEDASAGSVSGMLDPASLSQSGAAPGALIFPDAARRAGVAIPLPKAPEQAAPFDLSWPLIGHVFRA